LFSSGSVCYLSLTGGAADRTTPVLSLYNLKPFNSLLLRFGFRQMAKSSGWLDDSNPQVFLNHLSVVWQLLELTLKGKEIDCFSGEIT